MVTWKLREYFFQKAPMPTEGEVDTEVRYRQERMNHDEAIGRLLIDGGATVTSCMLWFSFGSGYSVINEL